MTPHSQVLDYNRVAGMEFNLASADNRWTGKTFYHQAFYPGANGDAAAAAANITYSTQYLTATLNQSWVGADYIAEVGYIRRKGYYEINPALQYKFFPLPVKLPIMDRVLNSICFLIHHLRLLTGMQQFSTRLNG